MAGSGRLSDEEASLSSDADNIPDDVAVAAEAHLQASLARYLELSSSLQQVSVLPPAMRCTALRCLSCP